MTNVVLEGINLPDLEFQDRFTYSGIESRVSFSLGGNPIVWEQVKPAGRPIILRGGDNWGALKRSVLEQLQALASVVGATYTLEYYGTPYDVRFMNEQGNPVEASPVGHHESGWFNNIVIKLMEV